MKVRLQAYRETLIETGVFAASSHSNINANVTVTVSGADATTAFSVGTLLYRADGRWYGRIKQINSATEIILKKLIYAPIESGEQFYVKDQGSYELDLQKEPNISINYQFDDVKDPSKSKSSFSQTFNLPFTDNNNKFFQDWYNVNLDKITFSTKEEYDATIFVGTVPQFDGTLQLRSVYIKAQYYVVTVFAKTSSLFSLIGDESLRNAFLSTSGTTWNTSLNHTFTASQMRASWRGSDSDFENTAGVSLKDPDHDIQKVMYPISVTKANSNDSFYFNNDYGNDWFLNKDQDSLDDNLSKKVSITQFRPAIQIKEMIKIILGRVGLSYTSDFFDSEYFSKIFMTTGGHLENSPVPIVEETAVASGGGTCIVGYDIDEYWGDMGNSDSPLSQTTAENYDDPADNNTFAFSLNPTTVISDTGEIFNNTYNYWTKKHPSQTTLEITHTYEFRNARIPEDGGTSNDCGFTLTIQLWRVNSDGSYYTNSSDNFVLLKSKSVQIEADNCYSTWEDDEITHNIDISDIYIGYNFRIVARVNDFYFNYPTQPTGITLGMKCGNSCNSGCAYSSGGNNCLSTVVKMNWNGYDTFNYGAEIDVPACIDPELKQKDFLKDLIQRFNLIITTNPNNPSNIIIEPYDTYLASGTIRYWTDKLDLSKEIIVQDTSSLQKERIFFTDKEDEDVYNKEIKDHYPDLNVYGNIEITETNNRFAKGELKNEPFFSPYINGQVHRLLSEQQEYQIAESQDTDLRNMAVHYEVTYEEDGNDIDMKSGKTNPKLFWYSGETTTIESTGGGTETIYMHGYSPLGAGGWTAYSFTYYPLCTPYELTTDSTTNEAELTATTRSLYWSDWATPLVPDLRVFNWTESTPSNWDYCLYGYYWYNYLLSLHHPDSRLMDCYLNLSAVDIFNFDFNDEIFIKDTYWRILKIHNYQVGVKTSTKVTLIKIVDTLIGSDCDYSVSSWGLYADTFLTWCPNTDTDCTPELSGNFGGLYVPQDCCYSRGGTPLLSSAGAAAVYGYTEGELVCLAYQGSLPISKRILTEKTSIRYLRGIRSIGSKVLSSPFKNFSIGTGKTRGNAPIMMPMKDDLAISYQTYPDDNLIPFRGESHRIVLTGQTIGTATAYAYPQGSSSNPSIGLPNNSNVMIRVNCINTVTGGTNATHPVGHTESLSYYTAFKMLNNTGTQIGTAGGVQEFAIGDGTIRTSLGITLDTTAGQKNRILFGLIGGQPDTQMVWALTVDFHIQLIPSLSSPVDTDWALYQNSDTIQLQNYKDLLWN